MSHKLEKIFVRPTDNIKTVLERLSLVKKQHPDIPPGIALVVDGSHKLLGIVTNGDIRRAFASGIAIHHPVSKVMNKKPSVITRPAGGQLLPIIFDKIKLGEWPKDRLEKIIVVDERGRVADMVSFYDLVQKSDIRFKHIGIVGLGYVGLTLGITLADLGFKVKGYDANPEVMRGIRAGRPHFYEAGLERLLADHLGKNFRLVDNFADGNNCDVYFIAVGTPLDKENKPGLHYLESASHALGKVLKAGDAVVLRSTVPLGTTRGAVGPILERVSGLKMGDDFLLAFAPERTIEGKALEELRKLPQIIGGINHASADLVASIFNFMSNSTMLVNSLEAAEMVKLVNNTYRDVSFAFANEVSLVCHSWGIDTKQVIEAANYGYERSRVPMPSPGVGGYCLEKDPFIFIDSAKKKGYEPRLAVHARAVSAMMVDSVAGRITSFLQENKRSKNTAKIFVLGFAFKGQPVTSDTRGSTTIALVKKLQAGGWHNVHGFDPAVREADISSHGVRVAKAMTYGFKNADIVVIMNNHPDFQTMDVRTLIANSHKPVLFFDTWSLHDPDEIGKVKGVRYVRL